MNESYDLAQICLNGHTINSSARRFSQFNQKFCKECGAATITACRHCKADIRGHYIGGAIVTTFPVPGFCHECGKSYPWVETKIEAARELAKELEELTAEDKEILTKSINDIVIDSPRTTLGATRFKKIMAKVGKEGASALRTILIDIVSEAAKKQIWS
jgi:hypothetical protein